MRDLVCISSFFFLCEQKKIMGGSKKVTTVESEEDEVFEVEKLLGHRRSATDKVKFSFLWFYKKNIKLTKS